MASTDDEWGHFWRYRDESLSAREREAAFEALVNERKRYVAQAAWTVLQEVCDGRPPRGVDIEQMVLDAFLVLGMKPWAVDDSPKSFIWAVLRNLAHRYKSSGKRRLDGQALSVEDLLVPPADPEAEP